MVTSALGHVHENVQTARWSCVTLAGAPYRLTAVGQPDRKIIRTHESNPPKKGLSDEWCNWSGSLLLLAMLGPQKRRPSKVMAKALRAGFQRFIQRSWPVPFGPSDLTTR